MMEKIILTTGGTGGHIFPALAVAEALKEINPQVELLFIGATYGPEKDLAKSANISFVGLEGRGILGRGFAAIPAAFENLRAIARAVKIIRDFSPCAVAAFGGYACFPTAVASLLCKRPLLLHEQNAIPGTSIKLLAKRAATVCVSLPQTEGLGRALVLTGNPVRRNVRQSQHEIRHKSKRILVLGGSQGAHALNEAIIAILPFLKDNHVEILHQTGTKDYERTRQAYADVGIDPGSVQPFIEKMGEAYSWADLAICRAGASTIAELCIAELPSILVPFPAAIHDHQTKNARVVADAGGALLVPESRLDQLQATIQELLSEPHKLGEMSRACTSLARPDAALLVAREIMKLCPTSNNRPHEKQN